MHVSIKIASMYLSALTATKFYFQMKKVDFKNNELDDEKADILSSCLHNVNELDLQNCKFSTKALKTISSAISKLPNSVKSLFFHYLIC